VGERQHERQHHTSSRLSCPGGGRDCLLELLAVFFLICAPNLIYFTAGYSVSVGDFSALDFVVDMLVRVGWCVLIPLLLTRRGGFDWKLPRSGGEWGKEFGWGLLLILAIVGCNMIVALIVSALGLDDPTEISEPIRNGSVIATFLLFTPIIGLHEELLFRVYAQTRLTQVLPSKRVLPVFIAAGVFAAVHGYTFAGTMMILVFGLILGASYQANGKIPRLVFAHTLWNIGVVVLGLLGI